MASSDTMLQITNLSYSIGSAVILNDLKLSVERGQFYSLAGANGAGKSTLIKVVLDLIRNVDSGEIYIDGKTNLKPRSRDSVAYLPERFDVKKEVSGRDYLRFIYAMNHLAWDEQRIDALCAQLGFDRDWLRRDSGTYSKGMRQKLGLISCFMLDKPFLILDEPLSGLDPKSRYLFKQLLVQERARGGTVFYSTHMLADAEEICDRFGILHHGRIVFDGTPESCIAQFDATTLEQAYMRCISTREESVAHQASSG